MEIPNRTQLERDASKLLTSLSNSQRKELETLMGNPPNPHNVPPEFWAKVRKEQEQEIFALLLLIFIASAQHHGADAESSRAQGLIWAGQRAREISDQYAGGAYGNFTRIEHDWDIRRASGETITRELVNNALDKVFPDHRAVTFTVDVITEAQTAGGEWGTKETTGVDGEDWWDVQPDIPREGPCAICAPLHGKPRSVWQAQVPGGPPAHRRCYCVLRYFATDGPYDPGSDGYPVPVDSLAR